MIFKNSFQPGIMRVAVPRCGIPLLKPVNKFPFFSSTLSPKTCARTFSAKMSTNPPSQLTHTINLPAQLNQPVSIIAAPGVSNAQFRQVLSLAISFFSVSGVLFLAFNYCNSRLNIVFVVKFLAFFMLKIDHFSWHE